MYRIGANNDGFAISGTKLLDFGSALLGVTGALTVSTTLGVTGASTIAALSATSGTFSTTLGVTGATTLAALSATTGRFSGNLNTDNTSWVMNYTVNPVVQAGQASMYGDGNQSFFTHNAYYASGWKSTSNVAHTQLFFDNTNGFSIRYEGASAGGAALTWPMTIITGSATGAVTMPGGGGLAVTGTLSATTGAAVGGATAGAGGLAFPATAVAVADANTLDDYEEGSFTAVMTGMSGAGATVTAYYTKIGNAVVLDIPEFGGPSTSTAKAITGMPAAIQPTSIKRFPIVVSDNSGAYVMAVSTLQTSTFNIYATPGAGTWTASGNAVVENIVVSYTLN